MTLAASAPDTGAEFVIPEFRTAGGAAVRNLRLRYRVYGDPAAGHRNGWILVFHALTGSADVHRWWAPLLGHGAPLDTERHAVVAANLPGSCYGSSGPMDDPDFPDLTPLDMARAHIPLLERLGVSRLALVVGGSLGGMVALEWGRHTPVPVDHLAVLAAPAATDAQAIAWNAAQRMAIEADRHWRGGRYPAGDGPAAGLAAARAIAMITYRSAREFELRFGRRATRSADRFDVDHYLRRQGDKLVERFDARSYIALMGAMDRHDVGDLAAAGAETRRRVRRITGLGIDTDILYPAAQVRAWVEAYRRAGADATYREIESPYGHDAFLVEVERVGEILRVQ